LKIFYLIFFVIFITSAKATSYFFSYGFSNVVLSQDKTIIIPIKDFPPFSSTSVNGLKHVFSASNSNNSYIDLAALQTGVYLFPPNYLPINIKEFGAVGDGKIVRDGVMTASSGVLTSATAAFTSEDIGKSIRVDNAGAVNTNLNGGWQPLAATIAGFISATQVRLSVAASHSTTKAEVSWGTLNPLTTLQRALDSGYTQRKAVYIPTGHYFIAYNGSLGCNLRMKPGTTLYGDGDASILERDPANVAGYTVTNNSLTEFTVDTFARNYTVRNLQIRGATGLNSNFAPGSGYDGGVFFSAQPTLINKVVVESITVTNVNKEGIAVWYTIQANISKNHVSNCNFDAYNPAGINNIIFVNNFADRVVFGTEADLRDNTGTGLKTQGIYDNNVFTNVISYGIRIYSGDDILISNNLFKDRGTNTYSGFQDLGIFISPEPPSPGGISTKIGTLKIVGNIINGFYNNSIANSNPTTTHLPVDHLDIKANTIINSGGPAIQLSSANSTAYLWPDVTITGNKIVNWNKQANGSTAFSAISFTLVTRATVKGNRIYSDLGGTGRKDPMFVDSCVDITFSNNDLTGSATSGDPYIKINEHASHPTLRLRVFNNLNLKGTGL